jgi:hypothetical protein
MMSALKRHRLHRSRSNDGTALVAVDHAEIEPKPLFGRSCRVDAFAMKACIDSVQKELAKVEVMAAAHRADFERERKAERRMAELLKVTADAMAYAMAASDGQARGRASSHAVPAMVATAGRLVPARRRH